MTRCRSPRTSTPPWSRWTRRPRATPTSTRARPRSTSSTPTAWSASDRCTPGGAGVFPAPPPPRDAAPRSVAITPMAGVSSSRKANWSSSPAGRRGPSGNGPATAATYAGDGGASAAAAQRMLRRHLHNADPHPIRVHNPHLKQPPRLPPRLPQDRHATLTELPPHPGQLTHLQPQRHARGWRRGGAARQLQEPATQKEDRAPVGPAAELAVDGQPQRVAVEHPAALGVGGVQQQAAAQHVHGAMITQQTHPGGTACSKPAVPQPTAAREPRSSSSAGYVLSDRCAAMPIRVRKAPEPVTRLVRAVETEPAGASTL